MRNYQTFASNEPKFNTQVFIIKFYFFEKFQESIDEIVHRHKNW